MQHHYDNIFYNSFKYLSFRKKKELQVARLAALFAWKAADEKVSAAKLG